MSVEQAALRGAVRGVPLSAQAAAIAASAESTVTRWGLALIALTVVTWLSSLVMGFESGLLVLTVIGFVAAIVGILKPALGLFGIVMLCNLDSLSRIYLLTGGLLHWNTFNYLLLAVMLLHVGLILGLRGAQVRLLQALIAVLAFELLFSFDRMGGSQHVLNVVTLFGLLVYVVRVGSNRELWFWAAMLSNVMAALGSFVFYVQLNSLPVINKNAWSFFPLTSLFVTCIFCASPLRIRRSRLLLAMVLINAMWVYLSASRGSFFIAVVCLLFIFSRLGSLRGGALALAAVTVVALAIGGLFADQEQRASHGLSSLLDSERSWTNKTSGRSDLAIGGWRIFLDNPFGVGTGGFPHAWATLRDRRGMSSFREGAYMEAHSGWIKILAENGLPGIVLLVAFVLSFAARGWVRRGEGLFSTGLIVTIALSVAFLSDEFQGKGLWLLTAAFLMLLQRRPARAVRPATRLVTAVRRPRLVAGV